ncbi:MAG TPA: hypothetical protein VK947_12350, partial [Planococcus sp. (in: firmicutes)]|nr:hypothetical protein [Planococcus sp. (in: firmicutes)]
AIASFFNKKKGEQGEKGDAQQRPGRPAGPQQPANQQRPQRQASPNRNTGQGAFKRVEDYAREMYGELQAQMNENPERTEQAKKKLEQAAQHIPKREAVQPAPSRDTGRLSAHQSRQAVQEKKTVLKDELFPLDAADIQKGIIMAEILLPPKSKR